MTGLTNYSANNTLNYLTGQIAMPALPAVFLGLLTAVGTDANTGFTEVSGGAYARVQVAGTAATNGATTTASPTLHFASTPAWVVAGMSVYNTTSGLPVGTVSSNVGGSTTMTLTGNATNAVASGDTLSFSAFGNASGTAPATLNNGAAISFAQSTLSWGTAIAWGLYDASSSGNLLWWDFLGNFAWLPFEIPTASSLATVKAHGYASNDPVVFTAEYGGTLPSLSTGTMTSYTVNYVATPATDTINIDTTAGPATPIVTTSSGSGMVRKILQQLIPANNTVTFSAANFTLTLS